MTDRTDSRSRFVNLLSVLLLVPGLLLAFAVSMPPPARAAICDQVGGVISGDWTVNNVQVCTGIVYTVDGSVTIGAGGSLTLVSGGLNFAKDAAHSNYALTISGGGALVLDNSIVTTETNAIAPYLRLPLTVTGAGSRLTMVNGASLKFPGWFNATDATIELTDSTITGFTPSEVLNLGVYADDHDDGPVIDWASTTATLERSRIERIYENTSAAGDPNATGIVEGDIVLRSATNLYAYDSHLGVDYSNVRGLHNELHVDATSNAYLYGVTIDQTQDPVVRTDWRSAYAPQAAGGTVFLFRWLHVSVVDSTDFPVSGAMIASTLSPSLAVANYPDNFMSTTPSLRTLGYLNRAASGSNAWNVTDANGLAVIPLHTDDITTTSLPNAESFGNYQETVTFGGFTVTAGANFPAYPSITAQDNNLQETVAFSSLTVRTGPDLALRQTDYGGTMQVTQGQAFTVHALIYNQGQTTATGVSVAAYLDGNRNPSAELARAGSLTVVTFWDQALTVSGIGTTGAHTLMLIADPDNTINEGGVAQENNNFANITLDVQPPPNGYVAILLPNANAVIETGTSMGVTGYVRDQNQTGLVGVPLTIELRSGVTVIASNTTTSESLGFFQGILVVPANTADGAYTVVVTPASGPISPDSRAISIKAAVPFLNTPLFGLPMWIWLIIIVGAAAAIGGGTAYVKFVGLGKLVECGECGSYIAQDSGKCPKCGVEFEKDMAKCSNCQTWVPVTVKQCPECGVAFATGEVEIADYEEQMRRQYDDVKRRFREEASRELGRSLNDREFADWWKMQPTFVTFEEWLREEEDMRKMGSKPCPACNTLNSVTATVCHKCGTLLKAELRARAAGRVPRTVTAAETAPTDPVPAKVVKKAAAGPVVVQKKVVTEPPEGQGGQGSNAATGNEQKSDDDI